PAPKKEPAEQPRVVPNYVSETKPTTPELETRSVPTFTTPPSTVSARETGTRGAAEVVAAKHTWSVENKTTAPEPSQPASGIVQTTFSAAGTAAAEPVDEFHPAYFNQQAAKESKGAGPGR